MQVGTVVATAGWVTSVAGACCLGSEQQRPRLHATWWPALQATQRDQSWPVRPMVVSDCAANDSLMPLGLQVVAAPGPALIVQVAGACPGVGIA